MSKLPLRVIPLSALRVGMHVAKLDIPWLASPFISHSRTIKHTKDIDMLRGAGVRQVTIDPNKGLDYVAHAEVEPTTPEEDPQAHACLAFHHGPPCQLALEAEMQAAREIRAQVTKAVEEIHRELSTGNRVTTEDIAPHVEHTLQSLGRNNQALLNLAHISRRSQKIADHTFSTFCIALNLAQNMQFSDEEIVDLGVGALVHEVGWSQIPIQLMGKRSPYTETERKLIERHTDIALKAVAHCAFPEISVRIVAEHHELCNGGGYPKQLRGTQLHPLSKLFSVVDRYDELVHQLTDSAGMLPANALKALYQEAMQNIYDASVVARLIALLGAYPVSSAVVLSDGSLGIVRGVPPNNHLRPLVEIRIDAQGKVVDTPFYIDLASDNAEHAALRIDRLVDPATAEASLRQHLILED